MKARTYADLEKKMKREIEVQIAEYEYQIQEAFLDNAFCSALAVAVAVFHRRGRTPEYIRRFCREFTDILSMPILGGGEFTNCDMIEQFEQQYGVDFSELHVNRDSREEFFKRQGVRLRKDTGHD